MSSSSSSTIQLPRPHRLSPPPNKNPPITKTISLLPLSKIEHIVISGGGIYGFTFYGILKQLHKMGIWELSNIKTFYSTSVGSIVSTIIALNYDWETMDRYLINRPLEELFELNISTILNCIDNCGFFTIKIIEELFYNLFTGKDLSPTITMKEFHQITGIDMHFFTTKLDGFECIDLSHKTHPDWLMVEAIYASCSVFPFLNPLFKDNEKYGDGGILLNCPLNNCIANEDATDTDTVLIIKLAKLATNTKCKKTPTQEKTKTNYSLLTYMSDIVKNILNLVSIEKPVDKLKNLIEVDGSLMFFMDLEGFSNIKNRKNLIDYGVKTAEDFIKMNSQTVTPP
jgi:predicted acylesterase/phospholipase RssA